jgi:DNA polymerase III delta prime subunit
MTLGPDEQEQLLSVAQRLIDGMGSIEVAAKTELSTNQRRSGGESAIAYPTNAMVHKSGPVEVRSVDAIRDGLAADLRRLRDEPLVARVVAADDDGRTHVFYFARTMPLRNSDIRALDGPLATYRGALGRLAEHAPGSEVTVHLKKETKTYTITERVRLSPARVTDGWDGRRDYFEADGFAFTVESLREFITQYGPQQVVSDLLAEIEAIDKQKAVVHEGIRRRVIDRISLRDEAVLDQYQGEIFRLPLNHRLMLTGPPGTGKTTTLIKRIAQKSRIDEISDEERALVPPERADALFRPGNWVMYAPTDLLRLYLKEAFAREAVAASDQRVRTWVEDRRRLGREVLRILRSESGGRFMLADDASSLVDVTSKGQMGLVDAFTIAFESQVIERYDATLQALSNAEDPDLRAITVRIRRRIGDGRPAFSSLFDLVEFHADLAIHEQRLTANADTTLRSVLNTLLAKDRSLIDRLAAAVEVLKISDEEEEEETAEEDEQPIAQVRENRTLAVRALRSAIAARARELHDEKPRTRSGRNRRVLDFLGASVLDESLLRRIGATLVTLERVRFLGRTYRNLIDQVPTEYQRFRRTSLRSGAWFRDGARSTIERRLVIGAEVDVMLLVMLRHARRFLMRGGGRALRAPTDTKIAVLESVKGEYVTQILVDEATDFSAVQLACMQELARPEFSSFFVCGDVRQRVTPWGVQSLDELSWVARDFEIREILVGYRQSRRLAGLASRLAEIAGGSASDLKAPPHVEDADIAPVLGESLSDTGLAQWLCDRIREVERGLGTLPSIAIFVDQDAQIDPLVAALRPMLAENNHDIIGCKDGRVVGTEGQIRVFDVQHIKGLEFEAVFFVSIDGLARRAPDLFDKFLFVGVTRAATYLGITCEGALPTALEPLRELFSIRGWG